MKPTQIFAPAVLCLGFSLAEVLAGPQHLDPPTPPPCSADGVCYPNAGAYGHYGTRWRRWPGAESSASPEPAPPTGEDPDLGGIAPPKPTREDQQAPLPLEQELEQRRAAEEEATPSVDREGEGVRGLDLPSMPMPGVPGTGLNGGGFNSGPNPAEENAPPAFPFFGPGAAPTDPGANPGAMPPQAPGFQPPSGGPETQPPSNLGPGGGQPLFRNQSRQMSPAAPKSDDLPPPLPFDLTFTGRVSAPVESASQESVASFRPHTPSAPRSQPPLGSTVRMVSFDTPAEPADDGVVFASDVKRRVSE